MRILLFKCKIMLDFLFFINRFISFYFYSLIFHFNFKFLKKIKNDSNLMLRPSKSYIFILSLSTIIKHFKLISYLLNLFLISM